MNKSFLVKGSLISFGAVFMFAVSTVSALNQSELTQVINDGTLSVDIVDAAGTTVAAPGVTFPAQTFSFSDITSDAVLGTASERIRAYNPTGTETWNVAIAGSATTAVWTDGGTESYDYNDSSTTDSGIDVDTVGGQLSIDPATNGTIAGVGGCGTGNVSLGAASAFEEGTTDSIDLMSAAAGAETYCRWDLTDVDLSQDIPASQPAGTYTVDLVMTIS